MAYGRNVMPLPGLGMPMMTGLMQQRAAPQPQGPGPGIMGQLGGPQGIMQLLAMLRGMQGAPGAGGLPGQAQGMPQSLMPQQPPGGRMGGGNNWPGMW